ncbi:MAG: LysR family transcriptional regulator [Rhizobiaceae bacterium]|nr:LysR family transcriptional regulator [Rhizobiaceae bacterium]
MHISRTDLNLLVIFNAIYTQGGVTKAAETLNLTQPTISHALGRLRERVNDPLFVRHGQKLVPTPAAHKMIEPIRNALQTIETALSDLDGFDPSTTQMTFTIGIHPLMEDMLFRPLIDKLQKLAPSISIASVLLDRRNVEADLSSGVLNSAIDVFLPLSNSIQRRKISTSPVVVVARKDHPALAKKFTLEKYLTMHHIIVSSRRQGQGPEDVALARLGHSRHISLRCQQISTAMQIVTNTDMILTMSETFARRANILHGNKIFPAPFEAPAIDTYLYWHSNSDHDQANSWLRQIIEESVAS